MPAQSTEQSQFYAKAWDPAAYDVEGDGQLALDKAKSSVVLRNEAIGKVYVQDRFTPMGQLI